MSIDSNLFEILVCPECKGPLQEQKKQLVCRRCRLAYPINKDNVPLLLADEAVEYQPRKQDRDR